LAVDAQAGWIDPLSQIALQQLPELIDRQPSLLQNVGERGALDWAVRRHDQLQSFLGRVLL
jgi:hypothetical protein